MFVALTVATSSGPPSKGGARCSSSSSRPTALNHGTTMHLKRQNYEKSCLATHSPPLWASIKRRSSSFELRIILNLSGGCREKGGPPPSRRHNDDDDDNDDNDEEGKDEEEEEEENDGMARLVPLRDREDNNEDVDYQF
ncbi:hypothetical protein M0802_009374 [Mischocyttarus mexicanus]|nr:hypothetical protein M0802_009374 [Mischocyttarus mexicanus]